jgi:hypothetical protein
MSRNCPTFCRWSGEKSALPLRPAQRHEIEQSLRAGVPYRALARQYSVSKDAVFRHRGHISIHTAPALATATKIMALFDDAEAASTWNFSLLTVREARHCVEELLLHLNHGIEH